MAYLVRGRTFTSYWDVNAVWRDPVSPQPFSIVIEDAGNKHVAIELARTLIQEERGCTALVDYAEEIKIKHHSDEKISTVKWDEPWYTTRLVAFDVETTGFSKEKDRIVEIGFSVYDLGSKQFIDASSYLINDGVPIPQDLIDKQINDITNETIKDAPSFEEMVDYFFEKYITRDSILISHNRGFDMGFLINSVLRSGRDYYIPPCMCSMELAIKTPVGQEKNTLEVLGKTLELEGENSHRAGDDAHLCGNVFMKLARNNSFFTRKDCTARSAVDFFDKNTDI